MRAYPQGTHSLSEDLLFKSHQGGAFMAPYRCSQDQVPEVPLSGAGPGRVGSAEPRSSLPLLLPPLSPSRAVFNFAAPTTGN